MLKNEASRRNNGRPDLIVLDTGWVLHYGVVMHYMVGVYPTTNRIIRLGQVASQSFAFNCANRRDCWAVGWVVGNLLMLLLTVY